MKSFIVTLGRIFLFIAFNLVIAEGLARVVHSVYPLERPPELEDKTSIEWLDGHDDPFDGEHRLYTYKPDSTGSTYGHPIRINRFGFRGADFVPRDSSGTSQGFRILVLGDSLSMGEGVAEEERYTNILEAKLRALYPSLSIEVINLGVQGFETVQEEKILYRMWDKVRPDLTVIQFYLNDTNVTYDHYLPYQPPIPSRLRPFLERLLLFRVLEPWYDRPYRWFNNIPTYGEVEMRSRNVESRDWKLFAQSVQNIGRWVIDHSQLSPFVLFLTEEPGKQDHFYRNVRKTFEGNGFMWVEPEVIRYRPVSRFEFHPDAEMHRAYAESLLKAIVESHRIKGLSVH